jgi:hypothetical protein
LAGGSAEVGSFSAGMAPAEEADSRDQQEAEFNKQFAAVEPVDGIILQAGCGQEAVEEQSRGGEIDGEMEGFPKVATEAKTEIGSNDNEGQEVERDGATRVFQRLAGRVDRVEEVLKAKAWVFVDKQDGGMQDRHRESNVAGAIVEAEVVESAMRPRTMWAVPKGHEHSEEQVQHDCTHGHKADIGGEVEDG